MRVNIIRKLAIFVGSLLSVCMLCNGTYVKAAANDTIVISDIGKKKLSSLKLTDLKEPVLGVPFDTSAKITSAEGVSWTIPVLWVDDSTGLLSAVPEAGKNYYPSFVFYIPSGYKIAGTDPFGRFDIKLPEFVMKIVGTGKIVYATDPATGITFIVSWGHSVPNAYKNTHPVKTPAPSAAGNSAGDETVESTVETVWPPYVSKKVGMYCDDYAIEVLGNDFLELLVDLIKNRLMPQAANLLREGFDDSFGNAEPGYELSDEIGLFIFCENAKYMGTPLPDCLGLSCGDYNLTDGNNRFHSTLVMNAAYFAAYDDELGKWVMDDSQRINFDNTLVHELLHTYMYDYTRYGLVSFTYGAELDYHGSLPFWFVEGTASAVENVYQFRLWPFAQMSVETTDINEIQYTKDSVLDGYINPRYLAKYNNDSFVLDIDQSCAANTEASYTSGYLASLYLGYMDALQRGIDAFDTEGNVDVAVIRDGIDDLFIRLHGTDGTDAQSLDQIIADISDGRYEDSLDFQKKFIKGENNAGDNGGSLDFVTDYLTWLNEEGIRNDIISNGSILFQEQGYTTPLDWDLTEESDVYRVADRSGMIYSSVDDQRANLTGGKSSVGDGTTEYVKTMIEMQEQNEGSGQSVAAKTDGNDVTQDEAVNDIMAVSEENAVSEESINYALAESDVTISEALPVPDEPDEDALPVYDEYILCEAPLPLPDSPDSIEGDGMDVGLY